MGNFIGIENLNPRKLKSKEMIKTAEDCLGKCRQIALSPGEFFADGHISQRMFTDAQAIYVNPTESLLMSEIVKEGECFATVLGSGDFALDGVFHGAKEVMTFDINKNQFQLADLKVSSMKKLDYDEFWSFFSDVHSDGYFLPEIYRKIKTLDKNSSLFVFWDTIMKIREQEKLRFANDSIFQLLRQPEKIFSERPELFLSGYASLLAKGKVSELTYDHYMYSNDPSYKRSKFFDMLKGMEGVKTLGSYSYNEDNYLETKERLKKVNIFYVKSDLCELKPKLLGTNKYRNSKFEGFDCIYLSNIPEYMNPDNFVDVVDEQLMPLLKEDGSIVYCCQGTDLGTLTNSSSDDLLEMKRVALRSGGEDFIHQFQEINSVEEYQKLRQLYDISTFVSETLGGNGHADSDVFVKIKK